MSENFEVIRKSGKYANLFNGSIGTTTGEPISATDENENVEEERVAKCAPEFAAFVQQLFSRLVGAAVVGFVAVEEQCEPLRLCSRTAEVLRSIDPGSVCVADLSTVVDGFSFRSLHREHRGPAGVQKVAGRLFRYSPEFDPTTLSCYQALRDDIGVLRSQFDHVLFAIPTLSSQLALTAAQCTDAVVLVITAQKTQRARAVRTYETLRSVGVNVAGVILNDRTSSNPSAIY
jgi:hypothetical protein